jgi:type VI protein secretion system component Hcp
MAWFMKMDTIPAESQQKAGYMDVHHWQMGADLPVQHGGATGGMRKGESNIHDLHVTVEASKSTNELLKACLGGRNIPSSLLEGYKDVNGKPELYYKVTFKDALISSINFGTGSENQMGPVSFSLKFNVMEAEHKEQDKTGKAGSPVIVKFDAGKHAVS